MINNNDIYGIMKQVLLEKEGSNQWKCWSKYIVLLISKEINFFVHYNYKDKMFKWGINKVSS